MSHIIIPGVHQELYVAGQTLFHTCCDRPLRRVYAPGAHTFTCDKCGAVLRFNVSAQVLPGVNDQHPLVADEYKDAKHERHPHGVIIVNGQEVATTLQCPHCMMHFISRKGSGHRRTFCMKCMAVTCGKRECDPCRPFIAEFGELQGREF